MVLQKYNNNDYILSLQNIWKTQPMWLQEEQKHVWVVEEGEIQEIKMQD